MTHIKKPDTIKLTRKKEKFESDLEELEKAIEKLSKPYIVVNNRSK